MSEIQQKLRIQMSRFIKVDDVPHPAEYEKRFARELRNAGEYFASVGLAKRVKEGPLYWEPLPSLPRAFKHLMEGRVDRATMRLLKQSHGRVSDEIVTHLAVFLGYMFCFDQLDEELATHQTAPRLTELSA